MSLLLAILYWALGAFLTCFAGRTTYYTSTGFIQMERPLNALVIVAAWVFLAYKYTQYLHKSA